MSEVPHVWQFMEELVRSQGLELFDMDLPVGGAGVLRIYIRRTDAQAVTHDDCAGVSERLLEHTELESRLPGNWSLEVSSPGINRRLRRPEHFSGAVGERVKIVLGLALEHDGLRRGVITGTLRSFDGSMLEVEDEELGKVFSFALSGVSKARVDFLFAG